MRRADLLFLAMIAFAAALASAPPPPPASLFQDFAWEHSRSDQIAFSSVDISALP